ncbi:hypothetical protein LAZ67_18001968 [Cordylochernes scorpioides]|uniref:DUF7041 domain-containing protein n=1 Tax=Cordylochernes scorpioides TaxID=51811 RepID=A0ABY6LIZ6_9ARAC|nr:hypothetical protein LAZ67_18001968 [Cordylochernes scorpioides]
MDSIKAPEFCPNDPELWFITLESQFLLNKPSPITNDDTKFSYLISLLPPSTAIEVPPEFCPNDPELWFITLESQFLLNKPSPITNDDTKFSYLISLLPPSTAIEVREFIVSPPPDNKFDALKKAIIKCTADSEFKKLQ